MRCIPPNAVRIHGVRVISVTAGDGPSTNSCGLRSTESAMATTVIQISTIYIAHRVVPGHGCRVPVNSKTLCSCTAYVSPNPAHSEMQQCECPGAIAFRGALHRLSELHLLRAYRRCASLKARELKANRPEHLPRTLNVRPTDFTPGRESYGRRRRQRDLS